MSSNISINRLLSEGSTSYEQERDVVQRYASSTPPTLRRAVVIDVIVDPALIDDEYRRRLREGDPDDPFIAVSNVDLIDGLRQNCIIARELTADVAHTSRSFICFPLLDPYVSLPVKPGEQVFVVREDNDTPSTPPFWLCRIPEPLHVDDVNYTHGDRRYTSKGSPSAVDAELAADDELDARPGFPNGSGDIDSATIGDEPAAYDRIFDRAVASGYFVPEPVPRYRRAPADTVVQGSNNAVVSCRRHVTTREYAPADTAPGAGAVDIVVGRGRTQATAPQTTENTRGWTEVDKTTGISDSEGLVDYDSDAARVYVVERCDVDGDFGIDVPDGGEATPGEASAVVVRADRIRLHAREDVKIVAGDPTSSQSASITLTASGDIYITPGVNGNVYLGGKSADKGVVSNAAAVAAGQVVGQPIVTTMGGMLGTPSTGDPHGTFSTKVVVK